MNHALDFVSSGRVGADARDGDPYTRLAMATLGRRFSGCLRRGIAPHSTCDGAVPSTVSKILVFDDWQCLAQYRPFWEFV